MAFQSAEEIGKGEETCADFIQQAGMMTKFMLPYNLRSIQMRVDGSERLSPSRLKGLIICFCKETMLSSENLAVVLPALLGPDETLLGLHEVGEKEACKVFFFTLQPPPSGSIWRPQFTFSGRWRFPHSLRADQRRLQQQGETVSGGSLRLGEANPASLFSFCRIRPFSGPHGQITFLDVRTVRRLPAAQGLELAPSGTVLWPSGRFWLAASLKKPASGASCFTWATVTGPIPSA